MKLPRTSSGHDSIWVIADQLTKSSHFLPIREDFKMDRLARLYINKILARHGVPISIISDRDWWSKRAYYLDLGRHAQGMRHRLWRKLGPLYERKCRSPILWAEVEEGQLIRPDIVRETTEKISQIKDRLKAACDYQKSYADK
ncbi:putative reverse transcriptase domain-containing protein [Tanacetum coccineum]